MPTGIVCTARAIDSGFSALISTDSILALPAVDDLANRSRQTRKTSAPAAMSSPKITDILDRTGAASAGGAGNDLKAVSNSPRRAAGTIKRPRIQLHSERR